MATRAPTDNHVEKITEEKKNFTFPNLYHRGLKLSFIRRPHFNKKGSRAALREKMSPRAAIGG